MFELPSEFERKCLVAWYAAYVGFQVFATVVEWLGFV